MAALPGEDPLDGFAPVIPASLFVCGAATHGNAGSELPPNLLVHILLCLGNFEAPGATDGSEEGIVTHFREIGTPLRVATLRRYATDGLLDVVARSSAATLATLDASYSTASDRGLQRLFALTQLRVLRLAQCYGVTDAVLSAGLPHLRYLRTLVLDFCRRITVRSMRALDSLPELTTLSLSGCDGIFGWPGGEDMNASVTGARAIAAAAPGLTCLNVSVTEVHDPAVAVLANGFPRLRELRLKATQVTSAGVVSLAPLASSLEVLELAGLPKVGNPAMEALGSFRRLTDLDLEDTAVSNILPLDGVLSLRELRLWRTNVYAADAEALRGTPGLQIHSNFRWERTPE